MESDSQMIHITQWYLNKNSACKAVGLDSTCLMPELDELDILTCPRLDYVRRAWSSGPGNCASIWRFNGGCHPSTAQQPCAKTFHSGATVKVLSRYTQGAFSVYPLLGLSKYS